MEFVQSRPDVIRSVRQRWLLHYWYRLRREQSVPSWQNLVAEELAKMADSLQFCDIINEDGRRRFLIRFRGGRIIQAYGDTESKFLDDTLSPAMRDMVIATYDQVADVARPVYTICSTEDQAGTPVDFERLLLPFSRDGATVDRVLASLEWVSIEGGFQQRELLKDQAKPLNYSVCATIELIDSDTTPA
jgi:hypothetical protein